MLLNHYEVTEARDRETVPFFLNSHVSCHVCYGGESVNHLSHPFCHSSVTEALFDETLIKDELLKERDILYS
jgi:hypothetical protein